jgi:hypothetical protein
MKLLFENWQKYLNEGEVKYSGILKLKPDQDIVQQLHSISAALPEEAVLLPENLWHVTLIHQSILKPYKKQLKEMDKIGQLPEAPTPLLSREVEERVDEALRRKSWVVWLENQEEMRGYVNSIMKMVGGVLNPEPDRRFHISLANLTGNPGDSVK